MKLLQRVGTIVDRINSIFVALSYIVLLFIVIAVSVNVILRYGFNSPIMWIVPITQNCLLYITFLAAAWVLQRDGHVSLDLLISHLSPHRQAFLQVVNCAVGLAICLVITWFGTKVTWTDFMSGALQATITRIPKASVLFIIPVGSLLLSIEFLRRGYARYKAWKTWPKPVEGQL